MYENNVLLWLIGAIDSDTKHIRLDVTTVRNTNNLKKFVYNHIEPGINIIHDCCSGYSFLDDDDAIWTHEDHIHGYHDFGLGEFST